MSEYNHNEIFLITSCCLTFSSHLSPHTRCSMCSALFSFSPTVPLKLLNTLIQTVCSAISIHVCACTFVPVYVNMTILSFYVCHGM